MRQKRIIPEKHLIYGLFDPITQQLRYIGKTSRGMIRPLQHKRPSGRKGNSHVRAWLRYLFSIGYKPEIEILEELPDAATTSEAECFWIAYWLSIGARLTNMTVGGDGAPGIKWSQQVIERRRQAQKLTGNGLKGSKQTPEHIEKRAQALRGTVALPWTIDQRRKAASAHGGKPFQDEQYNIWFTLTEAAAFWSMPHTSIYKVLKGKIRKSHGHVFSYVQKP